MKVKSRNNKLAIDSTANVPSNVVHRFNIAAANNVKSPKQIFPKPTNLTNDAIPITRGVHGHHHNMLYQSS
jgi:hypothetical protein